MTDSLMASRKASSCLSMGQSSRLSITISVFNLSHCASRVWPKLWIPLVGSQESWKSHQCLHLATSMRCTNKTEYLALIVAWHFPINAIGFPLLLTSGRSSSQYCLYQKKSYLTCRPLESLNWECTALKDASSCFALISCYLVLCNTLSNYVHCCSVMHL